MHDNLVKTWRQAIKHLAWHLLLFWQHRKTGKLDDKVRKYFQPKRHEEMGLEALTHIYNAVRRRSFSCFLELIYVLITAQV